MSAAMIVCLGASGVNALAAQGSTARSVTPSAGAACTAPPQPVASVIDTIYAALRPEAKYPLPTDYVRLLLRGIIEHFTVPSPLDVPDFGERIHPRPVQLVDSIRDSAYLSRPESVSVAMSAEIVFTVMRDGRLADFGLAATSLSPSFDDHLLHALAALDSTGAVPPLPADVGSDAVRIYLEVDADRDSTLVSEPLFVAQMPVWVMGQRAIPNPNGPFPRYPVHLEMAHVSGSVLFSFVVDDTGVPVMETVRLHHTTRPEFAKAVRDVLPKIRFTPARIDGCPVAQRVQMPFQFTIR
jgi:TonB family protein